MSKIFEVPLYPYCKSADQDALAPVRRPVAIVGAGPIGLAAAIDLAQFDVPVVVLDENDRVSRGSRAICFAKRPLEILDRLGCGDVLVDKGVVWNKGKVFFDRRQVYDFDLLAESDHKRPAFVNLQQYHLEHGLVERVKALAAAGKPVDLRGENRVTGLERLDEGVRLEIETPDGPYRLEADWVIACDGANSPLRKQLGLDFHGRVFEDNFLIADVIMDADFPAERWFWFDPPFNRGQSALLHKQPDRVWRIDLQLGWDIDREREKEPARVTARLKSMLGEEVGFTLEWISIYTFQCRRMERFRHGRVLFAGDAAHQVSPFGARGANSGFQDTDNLCWKLAMVLAGKARESLLDSYDRERVQAADENILNSTRSTDFITPKSRVSRRFRDAVLDLAEEHAFARPLVNSGRLSLPATHDGSPLNGEDCRTLPRNLRPGAPAIDAPSDQGWLLDRLGGGFHLLGIDCTLPESLSVEGVTISCLAIQTSDLPSGALRQRYLGDAPSAVYLLRPDQHVMARWPHYDEAKVKAAFCRAIGNCLAEAAA